MKPYSFKNFWIPFIIFNLIIFALLFVMPDADYIYTMFIVASFYFYNRGMKVAKKIKDDV